MANPHHASCKPSDNQLVFWCSQCGFQEEAGHIEFENSRLKARVEELELKLGDVEESLRVEKSFNKSWEPKLKATESLLAEARDGLERAGEDICATICGNERHEGTSREIMAKGMAKNDIHLKTHGYINEILKKLDGK